MMPPFSTARLALYAALTFVLTFGIGAAGVSALQGGSDLPADITAGGRVAFALVPIEGGAPVMAGREDLTGAPGARATTTIAPALATQLLITSDGTDGLSPRELRAARAAVVQPADADATDRLGATLDALVGSAEQARAAVAQLAGVAVQGTSYRELPWPLLQQARFHARLLGRCALPAADSARVLRDMATAGREITWGLGALENTRGTIAFTGASEQVGPTWFTRQVGLTTIRGVPVAVAIAAESADRRSGEQAVTAAVKQIVQLRPLPVTGTGPCA